MHEMLGGSLFAVYHRILQWNGNRLLSGEIAHHFSLSYLLALEKFKENQEVLV